MKIFLAADHGGFELKEKMKPVCAECWAGINGAEIVDCGAYQLDPTDDYPDFVINLGRAMQAEPDLKECKGIVFCRSGNGVAMAANRFHGLRCGVCFTKEHAEMAVKDDHINVLALPADYIATPEEIAQIIRAFFRTQPDLDPRHVRRVAKVMAIEAQQCSRFSK